MPADNTGGHFAFCASLHNDMDLISVERARALLPNAPSCDDPVIASMISAASGVIEGYCRRSFTYQTYDELQTITGWTQYLFVNNPPITSVTAVRSGQLPALYIQFKDPQNQTQTASVQVDSSQVLLTSTFNNTTTTHPFTFASYPTFGALGTAVNALNTSWQATIAPQFQYWQTSDLIHQGSWGARNITVPLPVYWYQMPFFRINSELGELYTVGGWIPGYQAYRVTYTGGYSVIPDDLQYACAALVQLMYATRNANPLMNSETLAQYSYTKSAEQNLDNLGEGAKLALQKYRLIRVARYK